MGAGLAGLNAARILSARGVEVVVLESAERVGGRVATDHVDGYTIDRGFQVLNPGYPQARRALTCPDLDLRRFPRGVAVGLGGGELVVLADPVRVPRQLPALVRGAVGGRAGRPWELAALAAYVAGCAALPVDRLGRRHDVAIRDALKRAGVGRTTMSALVEPFLSGVLADTELATSRRYADLVLRSFVRGDPSLPAAGMAAIPEQLAAGLPDGTVRLGCTVRAIRSGRVVTEGGVIEARAVVVATAAPAAVQLLPGLDVPRMRSLTTWYFDAPAAALTDRQWLVVDGRTPRLLANVAVLSSTVPSYAPAGRALVAATAVGEHAYGPTAARARDGVADLLGLAAGDLDEVARRPISEALPSARPPLDLRRPVDLGDGVFVVGDHRDTPSIQGALASGARGARAVAAHLGT